MTKKEIIKYLKNNELDISSAEAALMMCDLVFPSYVNSDFLHGVNFSPNFVYISTKELDAFFQIVPKEKVDEITEKTYSNYLKNPESLYRKKREHYHKRH